MRRLATVIMLGIALCVSSRAVAGTVAYGIAAPATGTQNFGGSLGMDFDVNAEIVVTDIGVFDSDQDGFNLPITAQLWTRDGDTGTLIAGSETTFTAENPGTLMEANRFKSLDPPIVLGPGSYTINAFGYGDGELNGNEGTGGPVGRFTDDGGGLITFVGGGRYGVTAGDFPNVPDGGPVNRYAAGTFIFVPEPVGFGMAAMGLIGLLELARRRRRSC